MHAVASVPTMRAVVAGPTHIPIPHRGDHMMTMRSAVCGLALAFSLCAWLPGAVDAQTQTPIKIGFVQGLTGALEVYAKQEINGFKLGLEYATGGKMEIGGRKVEVIVEDDQL